MKIILWTLTLGASILALLGCYAVGTFVGHDEQIVPWEPTLTVETPTPPPAQLQAQPVAAAPHAIIKAPDLLAATQTQVAPAPVAVAAPKEDLPKPLLPVEPDPNIVQVSAPEQPEKTAAPTQPAMPSVSAEKMIEDAAKLDSNSTRRSVYVAVAKRPDLGPNAQVRLINDTYDNLLSETAMEEVFITLIQNPAFAPAAQHAILKRADDFLSESAKQRITAALTPK